MQNVFVVAAYILVIWMIVLVIRSWARENEMTQDLTNVRADLKNTKERLHNSTVSNSHLSGMTANSKEENSKLLAEIKVLRSQVAVKDTCIRELHETQNADKASLEEAMKDLELARAELEALKTQRRGIADLFYDFVDDSRKFFPE